MTKKMLINATHLEENRVAIVEDGILSELDIEIAGKEQTRGNIYKASVVRIEPGLQAAFVDYGAERFGFLQIGEIHPKYHREGNGNGRPNISEILRRGQELLVQVVKEERGTKGAALTTYLSLPGRYMVLMPGTNTKGISRKIEEEPQRKKLKEAMNSLDLPPDMGYIVRTAGIGQPNEELKRDFDYLVRVYRNIEEQASKVRSPALIYKESNLVIRVIRDYFTSDMDEVLVDDPKVAEEAREFFEQVMPEYARLVKLHQERRPIFSRFQIEEQIETISKNKVSMPSGGSIVIDPTEALVAIDVNSGKMAGEQGVESTAFKTNLEAAREVARQLRLRDLGGLIVIDFIDMRDRKHIRDVEKTLKDALKTDKARVTVGRISQFGLLEMSRQRIRAALAEASFLTCPHCQGSGRIKSPETQAIAFLRKMHAAVSKGQIGRVEGEVPIDVANYLLNAKREELLEMERRHQIIISIKGLPGLNAGESDLTVHKRGKEEPVEVPLVSPVLSPPPEPKVSEETKEKPQEAAEAAAPEGEAEQNRKKRKRRRRRKKAEETPSEEQIEAQEPSAPQAQPEAPVLSQPEEETAPGSEPTPMDEKAAATEPESAQRVGEPQSTEEQADEVKKKRRRRRRRKPAAEEAELQEAAEAPSEKPSAEAEGTPTPPAELPAEEIAKEEEIAATPEPIIPEQLPPAEPPSGAPPVPVEQIGADQPQALPQAEAPPALIAEQKEEEKPTPRRRKRTTKKAVTEKAEPERESLPEEQKAEEEKPAAEKAPKSRARPRRKTTPAEPTEVEKEAEPSAVPSGEGASEEEAKPKRRPPRRKKPAAKPQEGAADGASESGGPDLREEPSAAETGTVEEGKTEEKKKAPRRTTRKKKEEAPAGSDEGAESGQVSEKKGSEEKPAPKKPARRRAPARKKTPQKESPEADKGSTDESPQE